MKGDLNKVDSIEINSTHHVGLSCFEIYASHVKISCYAFWLLREDAFAVCT